MAQPDILRLGMAILLSDMNIGFAAAGALARLSAVLLCSFRLSQSTTEKVSIQP
jgi:hypothetical protein